MNQKFWNWVKNEDTGEAELYFDGPISTESWYGDEITPGLFKAELEQHPGDLTVWINSCGGDVFAASQIYTMLRNHKGNVTVKIDALAASAASVVAMAGDKTLISPTGMMMCHDPACIASGNKADMEKAIKLLEEIKESIINAYEEKSHLSRAKIAKMMSEETWLNAKKALQLGFVDGILFAKEKSPVKEEPESEDTPEESEEPDDTPTEEEDTKRQRDVASMMYTPLHTVASFMQKISVSDKSVPINQLDKRLSLLKY